MSVLPSLSLPPPSSLSPNTTVPALQKHVLQKPLCGRNGMNGACMMLVSFKKEREENEKKATQFLQTSRQVYPHWSGSLLIWSDVVCVLSVYFICVASCSAQSKSMLFTLAEATPAFPLAGVSSQGFHTWYEQPVRTWAWTRGPGSSASSGAALGISHFAHRLLGSVYILHSDVTMESSAQLV